ncbi:NAD+ synthase, partial [Rhodobacteraceae bacterium]|nr:NAD+ synthase [Paracoccaceae bacterium]
MKQSFSVMVAQLNPTMGDIDGNFKKIKNLYKEAILKRVDLLAFPEMFLTGYQTQDLILKKAFMADVLQNIERLTNELNESPSVLVGAPLCENN